MKIYEVLEVYVLVTGVRRRQAVCFAESNFTSWRINPGQEAA
jgi:hypothetical protein